MNILSLKKLAAAITVASSLFFTSNASAVLLEIGPTEDYYLGSVIPSAAGDATEEDYIDILAGLGLGGVYIEDVPGPNDRVHTRSMNAFVGLVDADFSSKSDTGSVTEFDLTGSTSYVLAKYGNSTYVWFVLGYVGEIDVLANDGTKGGGLSHVSFFGGSPTNVPDAGSTIALIALGLTGLGFAARRRKA